LLLQNKRETNNGDGNQDNATKALATDQLLLFAKAAARKLAQFLRWISFWKMKKLVQQLLQKRTNNSNEN